MKSKSEKKISEEDWKKKLTKEQYHVLREKGTEPAFTGKYWNHHEKGKNKHQDGVGDGNIGSEIDDPALNKGHKGNNNQNYKYENEFAFTPCSFFFREQRFSFSSGSYHNMRGGLITDKLLSIDEIDGIPISFKVP